MKNLICAVALLGLVGCASTTTQYYEAVQKSAEANARAAQAKFDALSAIAAAGDGQAASAAVMALAMTQTPVVQPIPQQSQAIQWASILAAPISNLGMMWLQTDSTKTMARYSAEVDLARITADATTQQALYGSFVSMGEAASNTDFTPWIDGMVALGTTGMDNLTGLGIAGFDANTDIAVAGFNQIGATAEDGLNVAANISNNAMTNLVTLGTNGLGTAETIGLAGMTNLHSLGKLGMEGIWMTNKDWLEYATATATNNGCVITTDEDGKVVVTCN